MCQNRCHQHFRQNDRYGFHNSHFGSLPEEYEVAIENLEERLKETTNKLGVEEVFTKLNERFKRINKQKEKNEDELGIVLS